MSETPGAKVESAPLPSSVPPLLLWGFRAALVVLLALYYGVVFASMRALQGHFGWSPWWTLVALIPTLIMSVFVLPLAAVAQLPENWSLQYLPASRRRRGLCPACGYPWTSESSTCPECGGDGRVRPLIELSASAFRVFGWIALTALVLGAAAAEACVQIDEHRFRREVERVQRTRAGMPVERPRQWPGSFATLRWDPARGFESEAPGQRAPH